MDRYIENAERIPWASRGRETIASKVGHSLLPIGVFDYPVPAFDPSKPPEQIPNTDPRFKEKIIKILGTGIQAGDAKIITCMHVIEAIEEEKKPGYIMMKYEEGNNLYYSQYPFKKVVHFIDPRSRMTNSKIDVVAIPLAIRTSEFLPVEPPSIEWGDSTELGVGDAVLMGGYAFGTPLFLAGETNTGIVQPSFYPGIISNIIPAQNETETRILQIAGIAGGGISGGAVFDPKTGKVLGMVYAGLNGSQGELHPVTFALPSEIIAPFVKAINFSTTDGRVRGVESG